jgi:hypothetical protein
LEPGASTTCTASGTAAAGQYANIGTATGTPPEGPNVTDTDPSHYFGVPVVECGNPNLTVVVDPTDQRVRVGGDAGFVVTVTNSGDADLQNVFVDSNVNACDKTIGDLAVGESRRYSCTASDVSRDLNVSFAAAGEGLTDPAKCLATGSAAATVRTTATTIPDGIDTGTGVPATGMAVAPVIAVAVLAIGIALVGAGAYQVARRKP